MYEVGQENDSQKMCGWYNDIAELYDQLKHLGFADIDALDFSQAMLDLAKSKGIYKNYLCDSIRIDGTSKVEDHAYDVVCVLGGFTIGSLTPAMLPELSRMVKQGGVVAVTIVDHIANSYPEYSEIAVESICQSCTADGRWKSWTTQRAPYYEVREDGKSVGEHCNVYIATVA